MTYDYTNTELHERSSKVSASERENRKIILIMAAVITMLITALSGIKITVMNETITTSVLFTDTKMIGSYAGEMGDTLTKLSDSIGGGLSLIGEIYNPASKLLEGVDEAAAKLYDIKETCNSIQVWLNIFKAAEAVGMILMLLSVLLILRRKRNGVPVGICASLLLFVLNTAAIIILFRATDALQSSTAGVALPDILGGAQLTISMMPSVFLWVSVPLLAVNTVIMAVNRNKVFE